MPEQPHTDLFKPELEYAFSVTLVLDKAMYLRPTTMGATRVAVYVAEGSFEGPAIRGRVLPHSGADWALARPDGVLDFDARYMLEVDDGTLIYLQNRGFRWGTPEMMQRMVDKQEVAPSDYYMRVSPKFDVPQGKHDWLARHVFVGIGEKIPSGNRIHYYKVL
jgi:hypothetical protein